VNIIKLCLLRARYVKSTRRNRNSVNNFYWGYISTSLSRYILLSTLVNTTWYSGRQFVPRSFIRKRRSYTRLKIRYDWHPYD